MIGLIGRCWADYPGLVLDVDAEEPQLRALATWFAGQGGAYWVTGAEGSAIDGMVGVRPAGPARWEVCKLYVHPSRHGSGLAQALMDVAEAHAATGGATALELWSDTRFLRAHRFYARRGYVQGTRRALHDLSASEEWQFSRGLTSSSIRSDCFVRSEVLRSSSTT